MTRSGQAATLDNPPDNAAEQLKAIMAISAAVAQGSALGDTLDKISQSTAELLSAQASAVIMRDGDLLAGMSIVGSHGLSSKYADYIKRERPLEIGKGPSGLAAQTGKPVCVADVHEDGLFKPWRSLALQEHYRSILCVPLRLNSEQIIGVLNVYRADAGPWAESEVDLATLLADHAAIAIRTADLLDHTRRQVDGLSLLVRSLRAQAHEHANRLHAIYGLLVLDEPQEARRLIATLEEGYHNIYGAVTSRVANPTLAGLIVAESVIARESGVDLALDLRSRLDELPGTLSDLDAITIVGNLLHNATEAVCMGPRTYRRVRITLLQRETETTFTVRDWGPKLPADQLDRLCERNYTTKPGHVGLGLSLVQAVVNRTGGNLAISSMQPRGLKIAITYKS